MTKIWVWILIVSVCMRIYLSKKVAKLKDSWCFNWFLLNIIGYRQLCLLWCWLASYSCKLSNIIIISFLSQPWKQSNKYEKYERDLFWVWLWGLREILIATKSLLKDFLCPWEVRGNSTLWTSYGCSVGRRVRK